MIFARSGKNSKLAYPTFVRCAGERIATGRPRWALTLPMAPLRVDWNCKSARWRRNLQGLALQEWTITEWVEQPLNFTVATRNSLNSQDRIDCSGDHYRISCEQESAQRRCEVENNGLKPHHETIIDKVIWQMAASPSCHPSRLRMYSSAACARQAHSPTVSLRYNGPAQMSPLKPPLSMEESEPHLGLTFLWPTRVNPQI